LRTAALGLIAASTLTSVEGFAGAPSALPLRTGAREAQCTAPSMSHEGGLNAALTRRAALFAALVGGPAAVSAGPFDALEATKRRAQMKKGEFTPPADDGVNPFEQAAAESAKKQAKKDQSPVKDLLKQGAESAKKAKAEKDAAKADKDAKKEAAKAKKESAPKAKEPKKEKKEFVPPPRQEGKRVEPKRSEPDTKALLKKEREEKAKANAAADAAAKNPATKADKENGGISLPKIELPKGPSNLFGEPGKKEKPKKEKKEKKEEGGGGGGKPKGPIDTSGFEAKGIDSLEQKLEKRRKQAEAAKQGAAAE